MTARNHANRERKNPVLSKLNYYLKGFNLKMQRLAKGWYNT